MRQLRDYTPSDEVTETIDLDAVIANMPDSFVIKGMFISPFVNMLPSHARAALFAGLEHVPTTRRYLPFADYPQRDYMRVLGAVSRAVHPDVGQPEGMRRLARDDFTTFGQSTLGKIILSVVDDARAALHNTPMVYDRVAPGDWTLHARDVDDAHVELTFERYHGSWSYTMGQLEGIVTTMGGAPRITVHPLTEDGARVFVVHHRAG